MRRSRRCAPVAGLVAALALAGCCNSRDLYCNMGQYGAALLATAPLWGPPIALANGFNSLTDAGPIPRLVSETPGRPIEQRDIVIDAENINAFGTFLYPAGDGRFLLVHGVHRARDFVWGGSFLSVDGKQENSPAKLPDNFIFAHPLGMTPAGLVFSLPVDSLDRQMTAVDPVSGQQTSLPLQGKDCRSPVALSAGGRYILCRGRDALAQIELATGKLVASLPVAGPQADRVALDEAGDALIPSSTGVAIRALDGQTRAIGFDGKYPFAFQGGMFISTDQPGGKGTNVHVLLEDAQTGRPLREVIIPPSGGYGGRKAVFGGKRAAVQLGNEILVMSTDPGDDFAPLRIAVGENRHNIRAFSFDGTGEWLLVMGDDPISRVFKVGPAGHARS